MTYTHDSEFGDIGGLRKGRSYLVEVDEDWIELRPADGGTNPPAIELSQGNALGLHRFSAGQSKRYTLELGRVEADSDIVHREDHGLGNAMWGEGVYWREGENGLPELESESPVEIDAVDEHSFRFVHGQTGERVDISDDLVPSQHLVSYAEKDTRKTIAPSAETVDGVADALTVENHGWETGQTVIYGTDPNGITQRSVPVVDRNAPALGDSFPVPVPDPEIGGLSHGIAYRVIAIDENTVRLVELGVSPEDVQPIDLTNAGDPGDEHSLAPPERGSGIAISSNLLANHHNTLWAAAGHKGFIPTKSLAFAGHYHDYTASGPLMAIQWLAGMGGVLGSLTADLKKVAETATRGNAEKRASAPTSRSAT